MKIFGISFTGKRRSFSSIGEAVRYSLEPSPYSYNDQISKLELQVEKLQEMLSVLVEAYVDAGRKPKTEYLIDMLGYGYEVEEDD